MTGRWTLPPLAPGEFAPDFAAPTRSNPRFHMSTVAGRYVLLGLMPRDPVAFATALAEIETVRSRLDDRNICAFLVAPHHSFDETPQDATPGLRWFLDPDQTIAALYGSEPAWFLLDPMLRIMERAPLAAGAQLLAQVLALPEAGGYAGAPLTAPVLIVPRVLPPELCRALIAYYDAEGGKPSGVMRDVDGRTVGVLDPMKRRRDVFVTDPDLKAEMNRRFNDSLSPMIARTFHFRPTRLERYIVACYDADEGGFFRPHRDNQALGTAHRSFAVSINLNAEEFEGGDLRFPEFGRQTYRPPTGGAVVFCCSLLHEATPVTRGRRYATLPFLYNEAGEAIRRRNAELLAQRAQTAAAAS